MSLRLYVNIETNYGTSNLFTVQIKNYVLMNTHHIVIQKIYNKITHFEELKLCNFQALSDHQHLQPSNRDSKNEPKPSLIMTSQFLAIHLDDVDH